MQQTTKYKFNLIDTSDPFSPEALNKNAEKLESALITHEAAVDSALKSQKLEWQAADDALKAADTALSQTVAANKTALEAADAAIRTALGSGGKTCRIACGSYTGDGNVGSKYAKKLTFNFKPYLVIVNSDDNLTNAVVMVRGNTQISLSYQLYVTWTENGLSWHSEHAMFHLNYSGHQYYYVALGY